MKRRFVKMHGLGNDFAILDVRRDGWVPGAGLIQRLADRRRGIGFDQLLVVEDAPGSVAGYRIFNSNGGVAGQCGNGVRCLARWLADRGELAASGVLSGPAGRVAVSLAAGSGDVSVDMGEPVLDPDAIPFTGRRAPSLNRISLAGRHLEFVAVSMGNPHAVVGWSDLEDPVIPALGAEFQSDARFPQGVNVGFLQVQDETRVGLRVIERGVGETPACGSGACAAVVAGRLLGQLAPQVTVDLPGGALVIRWEGEGAPVTMTGPADYAYEGEFEA